MRGVGSEGIVWRYINLAVCKRTKMWLELRSGANVVCALSLGNGCIKRAQMHRMQWFAP